MLRQLSVKCNIKRKIECILYGATLGKIYDNFISSLFPISLHTSLYLLFISNCNRSLILNSITSFSVCNQNNAITNQCRCGIILISMHNSLTKIYDCYDELHLFWKAVSILLLGYMACLNGFLSELWLMPLDCKWLVGIGSLMPQNFIAV